MKVAIISDLHGNMQALEKVCEDIKNNKCEKVFCLGDLAMAGPQPRAMVDFVRSKSDWTVIQGNTDKMIAEMKPEDISVLKDNAPVMANALLEELMYIEDERKKYLRNLPPELKFEIEGVKIHLVHGSPRKNNENIFPDMPLAEVEEIVSCSDADVIFCGHTHMPCGYQTSRRQTVVNAGSVGRPMTQDAKACYIIANFENGGFSIEHRLLDYDRELACNILMHRNFEGKEKIAQMLIKPDARHI